MKRISWRMRWLLIKKPWILPLDSDLRIATPRGGAGALIYYQGTSGPETARFLELELREGMVFADVGAHIGEFSLRAARRVGPSGRVYAFEPHPEVFPLLKQNVSMNGFENIHAFEIALSDSSGDRIFEIHEEPTVSALYRTSEKGDRPGRVRNVIVKAARLDESPLSAEKRVDAIKIDVEGAELHVLEGAHGLLSRPRDDAPDLILEFAPHNYARFGYSPERILELLESFGYAGWSWDASGTLVPFVRSGRLDETVDVLFTKSADRVKSLAASSAAPTS